ncbi:Golgin sub A member 3 [Saguinus oedipus]|uniref:Golgin sub A member 3 n=1 Tax=Saguinus oedipus TaxID=9490 RepID=A0ABQ9V1R8_SAGOE|nr:Golgin sub A member 3 [Saguinus oedipus]
MDGASAEQDGLQEDRSHSGPSALPEAHQKSPGPLVTPDQQDKAQRAEVNRASTEGESPDGAGQGGLCQNGPTPQFPDAPLSLGPITSPVGPDASPGVAGFHDNLRKSQGTSAEGSVRKEALQSLRLSLPMQETQLCKHPSHRFSHPSASASLSTSGAGASTPAV